MIANPPRVRFIAAAGALPQRAAPSVADLGQDITPPHCKFQIVTPDKRRPRRGAS